MERYEIFMDGKGDVYGQNDDNILGVEVLDSNGHRIPSDQVRVMLMFNRNAMLGFGTELVRRALQDKYKNKHWHLDPTVRGDIDNACREMGVLLHPDSPEVIVTQAEFGDLENLLS